MNNKETHIFILSYGDKVNYFLSIKSVFVYLREYFPQLVRNRALRYGKKTIGWEVSLPTKEGSKLHIRCVSAFKASGRSDMGQEHNFQPKNAPKKSAQVDA